MKQLSKSEIRDLNLQIKDLYNIEEFFSKKEKVVQDDEHIMKDDIVLFFEHHGKWIPSLKLLLKQDLLKKITVDMGAVRFMVSGADLMRPGIVQVEEGIDSGDAVVVVDENHSKPLCVVEVMFDSEGIKGMETGKVAKNLHYVGDEIWNA